MGEHETTTNGMTVWVNSERCIGRFCRVSAEVMVYDPETKRDAVLSASGKSGRTGTMEWEWFKRLMQQYHNVEVGDEYRPNYAKGSR